MYLYIKIEIRVLDWQLKNTINSFFYQLIIKLKY